MGAAEPQVPEICSDSLLSQNQGTEKALIVTYQPIQRWAATYENLWQSLDTTLVKAQQGPNPTKTSIDEEYEFDVVRTSADLTSIALTVSDVLGRWEERKDDLHVAFCFDSITHALSEYPSENAFRFCHVLSQYILEKGSGYFHITRNAHDEEIVERFKVLFDEVIDS